MPSSKVLLPRNCRIFRRSWENYRSSSSSEIRSWWNSFCSEAEVRQITACLRASYRFSVAETWECRKLLWLFRAVKKISRRQIRCFGKWCIGWEAGLRLTILVDCSAKMEAVWEQQHGWQEVEVQRRITTTNRWNRTVNRFEIDAGLWTCQAENNVKMNEGK